MVGHVKLEIAIQMVAEKMANILYKISNTTDEIELAKLKKELEIVIDERDRVAIGEIRTIDKIIDGKE